MITAVIIEDELQLRETNRIFLESNFANIKIVGEAGTVDEAILIINETKPQLVLMDIELADGNCFQVLQKCKPYSFRPIFITAYNEYALKAIKFSAIDYILKPVNEHEFCNAVQMAIDNLDDNNISLQTQNFHNHYENNSLQKKLVLRTSDSLHIININDISHCKSDNSYTTFFLNNNEEIVVSKSIKDYANLLSEYRFLRPHQSYLVNLNYITKIDKKDGGYIITQSGMEIPISARRKHTIFEELEHL